MFDEAPLLSSVFIKITVINIFSLFHFPPPPPPIEYILNMAVEEFP